MIGTKFAHYEITAHLGSGGFGDVYQATDSKLGRSVAIKLLPAEFATDPDRLSRFRREAQVLASLNHPNIAHIYGLEEFGETRCIVMEMVDGETLQARIRRGPIPVEESLAIAKQIAEALEAAHEKGVVHRDLKPGNVMLAIDGRVKVLDFGLAKAHEPNSSNSGSPNSPTIASIAATNAGVILGTAAYMAPEQARGKSIDKRIDIWAFGAVLFEMLTGRQTFPNEETVSDTLAAILKGEPDWSALPAGTPLKIRVLLERCLRKDPRRRLPDIAEARIEIEESQNEPALELPSTSTVTARSYVWPAVAVASILTAASLAIWMFMAAEPEPRIVRFDVFAPDRNVISASGPPLSPDGRKIAFVAGSAGNRRIWVRTIDSSVARPLAGTEEANRFVWSPDSNHIAFFAQEKLKRIPAAGGPPLVIANETGRDVAWGTDNVILFGGRGKAIYRISASGGQPAPASEMANQETTHDYPEFLPDGRHFLYLARHGATPGDWDLYVGDLNSQQRRLLPGIHSGTKYSPTGHVLFLQLGNLMAQPFDVDRLELSGEAFPVAEGVGGEITAPFSVSVNGSLAFIGLASGGESQPTWVDRTGKQLGVAAPPGEYRNLKLSPDGNYVAFDRGLPADVFVLDIARGLTSRFTTHAAADASPVWSPDSKTIGFLSSREPAGNNGPQNVTGGNLYQRPFGVVGDEKQLLKTDAGKTPTDWSRDGRYLAYTSKGDIWALPLFGDPKPLRVTDTPFAEANARISPDGRWITYDSAVSGTQSEVYVQSFLQPGRKEQVSTKGGTHPRWSADGKELFYLALYPDANLMSVSITSTGTQLRITPPVPLFSTRLPSPSTINNLIGSRSYDVSSKGFLMNVLTSEPAIVPVTVIHNWSAGLKP